MAEVDRTQTRAQAANPESKGVVSEQEYDRIDPWYEATVDPNKGGRGVVVSDNPTVEVFTPDGRTFTLGKGDRLRAGHPLVKARPELFKKVDEA
jgi:hypothetical protein